MMVNNCLEHGTRGAINNPCKFTTRRGLAGVTTRARGVRDQPWRLRKVNLEKLDGFIHRPTRPERASENQKRSRLEFFISCIFQEIMLKGRIR